MNPEGRPKWVTSMGPRVERRHVQQLRHVQGADHIFPVGTDLPGCPPRPEMLLDAVLKLDDKSRT